MLTFAGVVDGDCDAEAKQSRAEQAKQSKKEDVTCNGALLCFALLCLLCVALLLLEGEDTSSGDFGGAPQEPAISGWRMHPRAISGDN